ncbi:MAG: MMPL family transporter [Actinomycetota bacterium]
MFERLGRFVVRRRVMVLVLTAIFLVGAGAVGGGVADRLSNGGFDDPDAEATAAADELRDGFGQQTPNLILLVTSKSGSVDDPATTRAGTALTEELAATEGVDQAFSYWSSEAPPLKSKDGSKALILATIPGSQDEVQQAITEVSPKFADRETGAISVEVTGFSEVFRQMQLTIEEDLIRAESIALPITLIALILVFGSLVAASLPLLIGVLSIVGSFLILTIISEMTEVSIFALNLTTALGLGLAIDYSLFVVSRYREELRNGLRHEDAVVETVRTAGRTVAFSGLTVAISLSALLVFPMAFLRSFAYAGVGVVLLGAIASVTFLPALLAVLGHRVDKFRLFKRDPKAVGEGFWHRMAMTVMRRPIPIATVVIIFLLLLGVPFLGAQPGQSDDRALPEGTSSRVALDTIRSEFQINSANALSVVAADTGTPNPGEIESYASALSEVEDVYAVQALTGTYVGGAEALPPDRTSQRFANDDGTWLSVIPAVEAYSEEGEQLVADVRAVDAPFDVNIGGPSAEVADSKDAIFERIPLAAAIIGIVTFILLFLMFGGLLVPVKAIVLNLLSLTATFGAVVWIFQDGNLSDILGFTPTGILDVTTPILMFCIAFGLSMDYEVFLLSRIKEEHDRTGDNMGSIAVGLEHTGRIVTAAALLLSIVFIAFATSGVTFIKMFGVGLTLAVVMDATLIRGTLVPAFMRLAGEANWWAPRWMRRIQQRLGFSETAGPAKERAPDEPLPAAGA